MLILIARPRVAPRFVGIAVATLFAAACSSSGGSGAGPAAPSTGSLSVVVNAPSAMTPNVTVSGPQGYAKTVTATTTLTGLVPGLYSIAAASVMASGPIVGAVTAATVSGSPASVTAGGQIETATVTYAASGGSGGLWIGITTGSMLQYTAAQLASSTSAAPATQIGPGPSLFNNVADAVDANGNLWVATAVSGSGIRAYTPAQLSAGGSPVPAVVVTPGSTVIASGLAFDGTGNLWVADVGHAAVLRLTASQLASTGSPTPGVVIGTTADSSILYPTGLAFDAKGDLWVANSPSATPSTIVEFTPDQLTAGGAPIPAVTLSSVSSSIDQPFAIAFDAGGNLWVTNRGANTVVAFSPGQLAASGSPTPAVTLSGAALNQPTGLAFDDSGDLWVANIAGHSLVEFTSSQLSTSGSPVPWVSITGPLLTLPAGIAFDPHASGLPPRAERMSPPVRH